MADDVKRSRFPDGQHFHGGPTIVVRHLAAGGTLPGEDEAIDERQGVAAWPGHRRDAC